LISEEMESQGSPIKGEFVIFAGRLAELGLTGTFEPNPKY
jgi:hypothetical protein